MGVNAGISMMTPSKGPAAVQYSRMDQDVSPRGGIRAPDFTQNVSASLVRMCFFLKINPWTLLC